MVTITPEELWVLNVLSSTQANALGELQRCLSAREAYIKLLEDKYKAEFNAATGTFEPRAAPQEEVKKQGG